MSETEVKIRPPLVPLGTLLGRFLKIRRLPFSVFGEWLLWCSYLVLTAREYTMGQGMAITTSLGITEEYYVLLEFKCVTQLHSPREDPLYLLSRMMKDAGLVFTCMCSVCYLLS
ncbi:hypothetical protein POM88_008905 [Heracleum sosnowskyi]|uniref:Uncharacterized protein n=1 Tax=Heracleum sosnowskyi TaxID=360622 RepID=A0AAD8JAX1_9APIA|nr:hypothetical protein POM88_008905 [Heracleum sosnowskyi]